MSRRRSKVARLRRSIRRMRATVLRVGGLVGIPVMYFGQLQLG